MSDALKDIRDNMLEYPYGMAENYLALQEQVTALESALAQYKKSALTRRVFSLYERITKLEAENRGLRILVDDCVLEVFDREET